MCPLGSPCHFIGEKDMSALAVQPTVALLLLEEGADSDGGAFLGAIAVLEVLFGLIRQECLGFISRLFGR